MREYGIWVTRVLYAGVGGIREPLVIEMIPIQYMHTDLVPPTYPRS